jgi:hypothetical protein
MVILLETPAHANAPLLAHVIDNFDFGIGIAGYAKDSLANVP